MKTPRQEYSGAECSYSLAPACVLRLPHTSRFFVGRKKILTATKPGLVGRYLTVLDLKTSCRALSASVRWAKTICRGSRIPQPMRDCHESHGSKRLFPNMAEIFAE